MPPQTLKNWLQFTHSNGGLICAYPSRLSAWILSYFDFSLSLVSALFMFCICLPCVVSTFVRKMRTLKYNLQSQCLLRSQEEWQAISEGFVWIQTFHLRELLDENVQGKAQFIAVALLTQRNFIIDTEVISERGFNFVFIWFPLFECTCRPVGFIAVQRFSNTSVTFQSEEEILVTLNHGCDLQAGGLRAPFITGRSFSWECTPVLQETGSTPT